MPGALERHRLPAGVKESLEDLRELSAKAEGGDEDARGELRRKLGEASPAVIARASDVGRRAQHMLIGTAAGGDPLTEYALSGRLDMLRAEVAGENPSPLEALLAERVVACWMLVELFDALMAAQLRRENDKRLPLSHTLKMVKWQESANRRYLAAIRELARVRKLQANTPAVQYNTQINLG